MSGLLGLLSDLHKEGVCCFAFPLGLMPSVRAHTAALSAAGVSRAWGV